MDAFDLLSASCINRFPSSVCPPKQQRSATLYQPTPSIYPITTITMKAITTILFTLATLAFAAPNPNTDANPALLSTRQTCTYNCLCQEDDEGDQTDPLTGPCCVAGTLTNDGTVRFNPPPFFSFPFMNPLLLGVLGWMLP